MATPSYQPTLDNITLKVLAMVHSYVPPAPHVKYTVDSDLVADCGFDSLDTIEMVMMVEDEFDIELPDEVCDGVSTIGELVDLVMRQKYSPNEWYPSTEPVANAPTAPRYISMGVTSAMPGTDGGFTFVCFVGRDVPVGTEVFVQAHE